MYNAARPQASPCRPFLTWRAAVWTHVRSVCVAPWPIYRMSERRCRDRSESPPRGLEEGAPLLIRKAFAVLATAALAAVATGCAEFDDVSLSQTAGRTVELS